MEWELYTVWNIYDVNKINMHNSRDCIIVLDDTGDKLNKEVAPMFCNL